MSNSIDPENCQQIEHSVNDSVTEEFCWLTRIPNELLVKIFSVVPPLTLLAIDQLGDRLKMLTYDKDVLSKTDFSNSIGLPPQDLAAFFHPLRTELITELNFNHCQNVTASELQRCVLKCHNLCTLFVINCKFTLNMISKIFSKLTHLVNLSWTVNYHETSGEVIENHVNFFKRLRSLKMLVSNLKKLYLELLDYTSFLVVLECFLHYTSDLQELHMRFSNCSLLPFELQLLQFLDFSVGRYSEKLQFPHLNSLILMSDLTDNDAYFETSGIDRVHKIIELILKSRSPDCKWKRLWIEPYFCNERVEKFVNKEEITQGISCATICSSHDMFCDMMMLNKAAPDSIHTLKVVFDLNSENVKKIINAGGRRLKWLSIQNINCPQIRKLSQLLTDLFTSCNNITELNLSGSHFAKEDNPCSVLCSLKYLSRLLLPSCAIISKKADDLTDSKEALHGLKKKQRVARAQRRNGNILSPLKDMVENCCFVEELYVEGCSYLLCEPTNTCISDDFAVVHKWNNLKHLTMINLPNITHANFLELIAFQCEKFTSLHLEVVGNSAHCTYTPNLVQMLKKSACLKVLSIQHKSFDCKSATLWNAIGEAPSLEKLCLVTAYDEKVDVEVIVNAISKLEFLQVFHIHSCISNFNKLKSHIIKCLQDRNRKHCMDAKVVIENIRFIKSTLRTCRLIDHTRNFRDLCLSKTTIAQPRL